jgi:hypothetical protein
MVSSLSCIAKTGLTGNQTAEVFQYICAQDNAACNGITANATTGTYGAYSMCNAYQQLSFAMNAYYNDHKKDAGSGACDFNGLAKTQSPSPASSCSSVLSAAGSAGTGTVTAVPTGGGSGTGSSSSQSTSKSGAAGALTIPRFDMVLLQLGFYVIAAAMAGAGIVLL